MEQNSKIAIIGGDSRELYLADYLLGQGYQIALCGFEKVPQPAPNFTDPLVAAAGADAIILPLAGVKENLRPNCPFSDNPPRLSEEFFAALSPETVLFIGWARPELAKLAAGVRLITIADDDELAILNSIPTAEGAIAIAIERSQVTIHGSEALVVGFGRCARTLARMLEGIGAKVAVATRKASDHARAYEMGFTVWTIAALVDAVKDKAFIFNTVPALVLTGEVLAEAKKCQALVDLASGTGGTDFQAAASYGINAVLAPGLPGKVAPETAGKILAKVYPRLLTQYGVDRRRGL